MSIRSTSPFDTSEVDMFVSYEVTGLRRGTHFRNGLVQCQSNHTVAELKRLIHSDLSDLSMETLNLLNLRDVDNPSSLNISFEGRSLDESRTLSYYHIEHNSTVQIEAAKDMKTCVLDLVVFLLYIGLNIVLNLYNKWMFRYIQHIESTPGCPLFLDLLLSRTNNFPVRDVHPPLLCIFSTVF